MSSTNFVFMYSAGVLTSNGATHIYGIRFVTSENFALNRSNGTISSEHATISTTGSSGGVYLLVS